MLKTVAVIGGDLRQITIAQMMARDGYNVTAYGFSREQIDKTITLTDDIRLALDNEIIILPLPVSFDSEYINTPYIASKLSFKELMENINPLSLVFGGKISPIFAKLLKNKGIKYFDYLQRDELAIKNAIPTTEGAIEIAMAETPYTIHNSKCLVLGYGRIGKILSHSLASLGAKTYVMARKYCDLALIESQGYTPLSPNEAKNHLNEFDIIFNTVPALMLGKAELQSVDKDTLIIDLASKPGGVDFDAAKELNVRVIWALSLPGKVAPKTAGLIIKETICNILSEEV